jgi:hypothetical protein
MNVVAVLGILSAVTLGADAPAAKPPKTAETPAPAAARDYDAPPPRASPEDRALWQAGYDISNDILLVRNAASMLQLRAKQGRYDERLDVLAKQGGDASTRAEALRAQLLAAWNASVEMLARRWGVDPTRGCRYAMLTYEGVLYSDENPMRSKQLASARGEVRDCVARGRALVDGTARANRELEAVLARLDRDLAAIPVMPGTPAPRSPDASAAGEPAPAPK